MRLTVLFLLFLFSLSAFAQQDAYLGGNGGDDDEIMIKNTLLQVGLFLDSEEGKVLFESHLNPKGFLMTVRTTDIRVVENELTDKFGLKRCALNFPEKKMVVFQRSCLDKLRNNVNDLYVLLTHEILNLMGLELPDEANGSVYTISSKIGSVGALVVSKTKDVVFSTHCNVNINNFIDFSWETPRFLKNILKDKGYDIIDSYNNSYHLQISAKANKYYPYKIVGNQIIFPNGEVGEISSTFLKKKFNGLISVYFDPAEKVFYSPAPVRIERLGAQYNVHPMGFWKEALIESFMRLPSCIKY